MDIATIAPKSLLSLCELTKLQLCYAELALKDNEYRKFYQNVKGIVVLDHSPRIPRKSLSEEHFLEAIELINPNVIILPDVDFSAGTTVSKSLKLLQSIEPKRRDRCVGVLQGTNFKEIKECYKTFKRHCGIIGLASSAEKVMPRKQIADKLKIKKLLLLLEVFSNPVDELITDERLLGICTSYHIRLAAEGRTLKNYTPTPKLLDFYVDYEMHYALAEHNLQTYKKHFKKEINRETR